MHPLMRKCFTFLTVVLGTWAAACGSQAISPTDPAVPSTPGAIVRGTVTGGVGSSSVMTPSQSSVAAIRVTVVGTSVMTATDGSGRFVLDGVPSGQATLRFEGPGIDARLALSGLVNGQVLTIDVQVSGASARLVGAPGPLPSPRPSPSATPSPAPGGEVEFTGRVQSITPPSLTVAGRTVWTDASTRIKRDDRTIALTDLRVGDLVEVEGRRQADGSILARKIKVEDGEDEDNDGDDGDDSDDE